MLIDFLLCNDQPEKSIEVYEQALKKHPKDALLMRKVGQLYIKIHLYEKVSLSNRTIKHSF